MPDNPQILIAAAEPAMETEAASMPSLLGCEKKCSVSRCSRLAEAENRSEQQLGTRRQTARTYLHDTSPTEARVFPHEWAPRA